MTEFARTPDLDIGYEVDGPPNGRPLVAVHGWPDDPHCWDDVVPALAEAGFRVFRPYLRGFGPTTFRDPGKPRDGGWDVLGADLRDFLDALDLADVVVVGHDWGARAGYALGARFPERVSRLVAMSAGHGSAGPVTPLDHGALDGDRRAYALHLWTTWSPGWEFTGDAFDRAAAAWDNDDWPAVSAALHGAGGEGDAPEVRVPTLVLHGARDAGHPPSSSEAKNHLFTGKYERVVFEDVGHFPPREAPVRTARRITWWARP
ncbi:alpha/beta fold hydrolase [Amycolatopsis sp. NPDC004378]